MSIFIYILRLKSGNIYIGSTTNLENRYAEHIKGTASRMTKLDPPVRIAYTETYETQLEARQREAQIKRWSRAKKEALISKNMSKLKSLK
ncbi:GIY-YIG nuclease family protein [Thermodesulfobacteriota bacterium]